MLEAYLAQIAKLPRTELHQLSSEMWNAYGRGELSDAEAQTLSEAIEARKKAPAPLPSRRTIARPQPRGSILRRRRWAASGWLPPTLAAHFTQGENSALSIVAHETGACELSVGKIAGLAGVGESTVRNAIREAKRLGLLTVQERRVSAFRNLPNVVRIVSPEWRAWIKYRTRPRGEGSKTYNALNTKNKIHTEKHGKSRENAERCGGTRKKTGERGQTRKKTEERGNRAKAT